jgi:hypothetical protein
MHVDVPNFEAPAQSRANVASALTIGTIALLVIGVQPILLGAMVEARNATLSGVGVIAMCEIVALGLGIVVCDALMSLSRLRVAGVAAALFVAALDVATTFLTGDAHLAMLALMGGEPLLRPQFAHKVVPYAAQKGFWIYIGTNGRLLRDDARVIKFVWTQLVKNRMKGGARSFED